MAEITLILHNIRSTHNVGSIFRTAEGFGVKEIIISGYTPYPSTPRDARLPHIAAKLDKDIHKTALGAEKLVPFNRFEQLEDWLSLNQQQLPLIALEQSSTSIPIQQFKPPAKLALLLGEEVNGIAGDYLAVTDAILEIPMVGRKESYNVSVAAGIALYSLSYL